VLVDIFNFCVWGVVVVTVGTLAYCAGKTLWQYMVRPRL